MRRRQPSATAVRARLLRWFDREQRDLPWRRTRDPYRIWLAEIMLQQTRVPVVIPYYERFLKSFPTIGKLARAREEKVLRLWAGLGYYQRARNLRQAAQEIARRHGGSFPGSLDNALALPGVGAYTARAVLSIAFKRPVAVVDGNVARALARLFLLRDTDVSDRKALQPLADELVSRRRPGDFNQALMELGSTICLPRIPRCSDCPLEQVCAARQTGVERTLPVRTRKRARPKLKLNVVVTCRNGRVLMARERQGYFSGLWHFPYTTEASPRRLARRLRTNSLRRVGQIVHETTMRDLILRVHEGQATANGGSAGSGMRWVDTSRVSRLGIGAATRKIVGLLEKKTE